MTDTPFRLVRKGYEPNQVEERLGELRSAVDRLQTELKTAQDDTARQTVENTKQRQQIVDLVGRIDMLEQTLAEARAEYDEGIPPTFSALGERIGQMLTLAQEEAEGLRANARSEAERLTTKAEQQAAQLVSDADQQAAELLSRATAEATRTVEQARQSADHLREDAEAEATVRREEAQALYEAQRAKAAQAAADFERTLAERRTEAMDELNETLAKKTHEVELVTEELERTRAEAARVATQSREQAEAIVREAQTSASTLLADAKRRAEGIRQNSERELAAATARRDSITAQLANVRQMLATLGGPQSAFADPLNVRNAQAWASETDAVDEPQPDQPAAPAAEPEPAEAAEVEVGAEDAQSTTP